MTYELEYLMHLFSCGAKAESAKPPKSELDWKRLFSLADRQVVSTTAFLPIKGDENRLGCPSTLFEARSRDMLGVILREIQKRKALQKLLDKLCKEGFNPIILKGIDLASYYALESARTSSDTDILIDKRDEKRLLKYLLYKEGFKLLEGRRYFSHHSSLKHDAIGYVELHIKLWNDTTDKTAFCKYSEQNDPLKSCISVKTDEGSFNALGFTDGLIFVTLHMIKHFLLTGISMKMIMDTSLYFKANKDKCDIKKYLSLIEDIGCKKLMDTVFSVAVHYFGFESGDFPEFSIIPKDSDELTLFLDDMEKCLFLEVKQNEQSKDAWHYLCNNAGKTKPSSLIGKASVHLDIFARRLSVLFLPPFEMKKEYPFVKKSILLYPVALIKRAYSQIKKNSKKKNNTFISEEAELSSIGKQRLTLFKRLNILNNLND